jgi:hypothetical protein
MSRDILIVDGRAYSWKQLCELRRAQRDAQHNAAAAQPALFELHDDRRPAAERTAAGRYREPSLLDRLHE